MGLSRSSCDWTKFHNYNAVPYLLPFSSGILLIPLLLLLLAAIFFTQNVASVTLSVVPQLQNSEAQTQKMQLLHIWQSVLWPCSEYSICNIRTLLFVNFVNGIVFFNFLYYSFQQVLWEWVLLVCRRCVQFEHC